MPSEKRITIGIISYNDRAYLERNLPELQKLNYPPLEIFIFDNNPTTEILDWINKEFPTIKTFRKGENLGFGVSHNFLIDQSTTEFYLGFNSDMLPSKDFLDKLMESMMKDEKIGCVTGKLLQWRNFPEKPKPEEKQHIDTAGLIITKGHHAIDRGQSQMDENQFDQKEEIWGASGAAPLFRIQALKDVAHSDGEYFDKDFFLYKEDVDLSYRLRWAGWKTMYVPEAVAWHDRTTSDAGNVLITIKKRKDRSRIVKEKSFLNQLIFVYKNWSTEYSFSTKLRTFFFHLQYFIFALLFEPYLLKQIKIFLQMKKSIQAKRKNMPRRISPQEMEKWFI